MPTIRSATQADAPALLEIYAPFVRDTAVSFEMDVPAVEDMAARVSRVQKGWCWLVAEEAGRCQGYAYGTSFRERRAYRWSVETSVYVHPDHRQKGVGRALYLVLLQKLIDMGYCNAYAGITLPNEASVALHQSLGFEPVGVFRRAGWKFDAWHDVAWFQRILRDEPREDVQ